MKITRAIKQTSIFSMLALFLATTLISLAPIKAYAAPVDTYGFTDQLVSYKLYFAMADCVNGASLNEDSDGDVTDAAIASGNWYTGSENVITGIVPDPQVPADGRMECNTIVRRAISLWGFDDKYGYVETAKKMGFKRSDSGKWSKNSSPRSAMLSFIRSEVYGGKDPTYAKGFNYYDLFKSFINSACKGKKVSDGIITTDQKALGYKQITFVDSTTSPATAKPAVYSYESKTIDYGAAPVAGSDRRLECVNIANNLNAPVAEEYIAAVQSLPPGTTPPLDPGVDEGTQSAADECPLPDDTSMRWLGCSIMSVASVATEKLYGAIQNFLYTPTAMIFNNASLKEASDGIRNIAIGLVLIAGLIMVIAQATGSDLVDAYTLKKLIPRIGVAIIGIALAWPLLQFAITLTNDVGLLADRLLMGVTGLGGGGGGSSNEFGTNVGSVIFGTGAVATGALILGAAGVISLAGTILLALLLGLLVLSIRQLVIMVCVLIAPLAIAAYVLPGTQKLWSFWKNTLITTLLMFPIIMFFLASGKAMSAVLGGADSPTMSLLAVIVFIAPYFLLPFAFKLAGGLMSTIFSIANDKNRGMFDRLKKGRSNSINKNMSGMKHGNRFQGNTGAARAFNRTTRGVAAVGSGDSGYNPLKWGQRGRSLISTNTLGEAKEALEKNEHLKAIVANDDFLQAGLLHRGNESAQKQYLAARGYDSRSQEDAVAAIRVAQRSMSNDAYDTAAAMALPATGTAFKRRFNQQTGQWEGGAGEMHEFINQVAGGDRNRAATMLAAMRSGATQARRFDLAGGSYGSQLGAMNDQYNNTLSSNDATRRITKESLEGQGGGYIAGARKSAVEAFAPEILDNLQTASMGNGVLSAAQIEQNMNKELAVMAGRYDAMASVAPENARVLDAGVMSQDLTINGVTKTVQQHIEDRRGNPAFQEMRREYQSNAATAAQQAQMAGQGMLPGMQNLGGQPQGPQAPPF